MLIIKPLIISMLRNKTKVLINKHFFSQNITRKGRSILKIKAIVNKASGLKSDGTPDVR
jgi:hypothetical protein